MELHDLRVASLDNFHLNTLKNYGFTNFIFYFLFET